MDWSFALLNGGMCAVAIVFAAHAPDHRSAAVTLAALMTLGWAFYVSAWTDASPAMALAALGLPVTNKDMWSVMDALFGFAAIALAFMTWWGWALWATALTATAMHLSYRYGAGDFDAYSHVLDKILLAQMAIFYVIGGRGVADRIARVGTRCRRILPMGGGSGTQGAPS